MFRQPVFYPVFLPQVSKKKGVNSHNMRIGDWVCSNCGNLNFSFRNECNRCSVHQKLNNKKPLKKLKNRQPFQDLTNVGPRSRTPNTQKGYENKSGGFENLILLTPLKDYPTLGEGLILGKQCSAYKDEYENQLLYEDVSDFCINETDMAQIESGIAYSIKLLGIDE